MAKPLMVDGVYSAIGRATGEELNNLRKQLAPGCDPAFDYSTWTHSSHNARDDCPPPTLEGPLADLERALKEAADDTEQVVETEALDNRVGPKRTPLTWAQRQAIAPSSSFTNVSRDAMFAKEVTHAERPPPIGTYNPREQPVFPRSKYTLMKGNVKPSKSVLRAQEEARIEEMKANGTLPWDYFKVGYSCEEVDDLPEPNRAREGLKIVAFEDQGKGHVPLITQKFSEFTADISVLQDDRKLSGSRRILSSDFGKPLGFPKEGRFSYFQAGQYKCNYNQVYKRTDQAGVAWYKRTSRGAKGARNVDSMDEDPNTKYGESEIPDRSLAKEMQRKKYPVWDWKKQLPRPSAAQKEDYAYLENPSILKKVTEWEMNYDVCKAEKATLKKPGFCMPMGKGPPRDNAAMGTRMWACNPGPSNLTVSVEDEDLEVIYQSRNVNIPVPNFSLNKCRGPSNYFKIPASRHQDLSRVAQFQRDLGMWECRSVAAPMSKSASDVGLLRKKRSHVAIESWDQICEENNQAFAN